MVIVIWHLHLFNQVFLRFLAGPADDDAGADGAEAFSASARAPSPFKARSTHIFTSFLVGL